MADLLAVLDRDQRAIGAIGHDLDRRRFTAENGQAHEFEPEIGKRWRDAFGNAGIEAREMRQICVQDKRGGPQVATLPKN
ncbi:hypothetical protein Tasa_025_005 [Tanticharoenia sakaeratensis NBRC 103193]|uniref:Uncharacterized protein n=1 Tax=Tanticharoenia sakaeratensis NBRC 103193 TaxID=1231623 RepID=A0A0D6MLM3_9PROT|nr:hypothetical protein Tasa_025_005 [Tanticharoenia sakaeratensis NBRC 103193]